MVLAWSVDRLGRSLQDLLSFLGEASVRRRRKKGVGIGKIARILGIGASYVQRIVAETEPR
jgi:hypothetical protein